MGKHGKREAKITECVFHFCSNKILKAQVARVLKLFNDTNFSFDQHCLYIGKNFHNGLDPILCYYYDCISLVFHPTLFDFCVSGILLHLHR